MDAKDWELLKVLHEEKTAAKTSNRVYLSQPALTYRLSRMEKEIGTQLFVRSNRGVTFTSAGERLLSYADRMLRQYSDIRDYVNSREDKVCGTLRLGSSTVFAHSQLPLLLKEFHTMYPLINILLYTGLSNEILQRICREEVLVAIIRGDHPWNEADILLQTENLSIISANPVSLEDLPSIPCICYQTDPTMQYQIDKWWHENFPTPPKILMHADSAYTCRELVMAGLGWAIMPALRIQDEKSERLFMKEIRNKSNQPFTRPTRLIHTHVANNYDAVRVFISFICDRFSVQV